VAADVLRNEPPHRYTADSLTDREAYLQEVNLARSRGFAVERGEYLQGICAAAGSFIFESASYLLWAVAIDSVTDDRQLAAMGQLVVELAREIEAALEESQ
jgi:DNA-binding IclR family transcriptional regulator